jgi:hypothetical protein
MLASWVPDHQQPYNGNVLVGATIAITILQIVFVAARFYTRFLQRAKIGLDDYLILLALVRIPGYCYLNTIMLMSCYLGCKSGKISDLYFLCAPSNQLKERQRLTYHTVTKVGIVGYHFDYVSQIPDKFVVMRKVCIFQSLGP